MFASQYDYDFPGQYVYLCVERAWSHSHSERHHVMIDSAPFFGHELEINTFTAAVYVGPCDKSCKVFRSGNLKKMMRVGDDLRCSLIELFKQVELETQRPSTP